MLPSACRMEFNWLRLNKLPAIDDLLEHDINGYGSPGPGLCKLVNEVSKRKCCAWVGVKVPPMSASMERLAFDEFRCGFRGPCVVITFIYTRKYNKIEKNHKIRKANEFYRFKLKCCKDICWRAILY